MSGDTILNLSSNSSTRWMLKTVGLPTPMPLDRAEGPWQEAPLAEASVCLAEGVGATHKALASALTEAAA